MTSDCSEQSGLATHSKLPAFSYPVLLPETKVFTVVIATCLALPGLADAAADPLPARHWSQLQYRLQICVNTAQFSCGGLKVWVRYGPRHKSHRQQGILCTYKASTVSRALGHTPFRANQCSWYVEINKMNSCNTWRIGTPSQTPHSR